MIMNKHIIKLGVIAILFSSCHTDKKVETVETPSDNHANQEELTQERFTLQLTDTLIKGSQFPNYTIGLNLSFYNNENSVAESVNKIINNKITHTTIAPFDSSLTTYAQHLSKNIRQEILEAYDPDSEESNATLQYHILIGGEFSPQPLNGYMAYTLCTDMYTGGPHGTRDITYLNFEKSTGKYVQKEDVFNLSKDSVLLDLILKKIMSDRGVKTRKQLHEISSITVVGDLYVENNFLLEEMGITFVYNTYEIASYADGTIFVFLPYEDMKDVLKIRPNSQNQ